MHEVLNLFPCVANKPPSDFVKLFYSRISPIRTYPFSFLVNLINIKNTVGDFVVFIMRTSFTVFWMWDKDAKRKEHCIYVDIYQKLNLKNSTLIFC